MGKHYSHLNIEERTMIQLSLERVNPGAMGLGFAWRVLLVGAA